MWCHQKKGCKTKQQIGRSDVPTRNLVLCDPKTNQHIQIFLSESSKALLPTTTNHFIQTSLTLAQKQQILIIESELTPSFIKGPESIDIFAARHTSKDKHTSALMFFNCSCKSFLTVQLNCWHSGKVQQLARAKDFFYCLSVHLYAHLPSSALLLAITQPVSQKKNSQSSASFPSPSLSTRTPFVALPASLKNPHSKTSLQKFWPLHVWLPAQAFPCTVPSSCPQNHKMAVFIKSVFRRRHPASCSRGRHQVSCSATLWPVTVVLCWFFHENLWVFEFLRLQEPVVLSFWLFFFQKTRTSGPLAWNFQTNQNWD